MAQQDDWWANDLKAASAIGAPQQRKEAAQIRSSEAGAASSEAGAAQTRALTSPRLRKAEAEAAIAEAKAAGLPSAGEAERAKVSSRRKGVEDLENLLANIQQARENIGFWSTGPAGQVTQSLWGTPSAELDAALSAIKNPVVLNALQEARKGSAAGATGFGALSNKELDLLASGIASLKRGQSPARLLQNLNRVETHYRRMAAYNAGQDPDTPEGAYFAGLAAKGEAPKAAVTAEGGAEPNPELAGVNSTVNAMIKAGRTEPQIREWLDSVQPGLGSTAGNIDANIKFWKQGGEPGVNLEQTFKPQSAVSKVAEAVGVNPAGPVGAALIGAGDVASGGFLDELTGKQAASEALMRGVQEQNPTAYTLGQIAGGIGGALGTEGLAAKYGMKLPGLMSDIAQGAVYGAGSAQPGERTLGAVTGGVLAPIGGAVVRGAVTGAGAIAKGVQDPAAQLLARYNIPMTIGQIVRGGVKSAEDKATSYPLVGGAIGARRREGIEAFNRAAFDEALAPIGVSTEGEIGQAGIAKAQEAVANAYKSALSGVALQVDQPFVQVVRGAPYAKLAQVKDVGPQLTQEVDDILGKYIQDGQMTGEGFQMARQELRDLKRSWSDDRQFNRRIKPQLDDIEEGMVDMFRRQAPDNLTGYLNADNAYKHVNILGEAVDFTTAAGDDLVTPALLRQKSRQATRVFGGKAASQRGDRPFSALSNAGRAVLPSTVNDSGTAGRVLLPMLAASALGGGRYATSGEENARTGETEGRDGLSSLAAGATGAALAAAPYSRLGQRALQASVLGERPLVSQQLGALLQRYASPASRAFIPQIVGGAVSRVPAPQVEAQPDAALLRARRAAMAASPAEMEDLNTIGAMPYGEEEGGY